MRLFQLAEVTPERLHVLGVIALHGFELEQDFDAVSRAHRTGLGAAGSMWCGIDSSLFSSIRRCCSASSSCFSNVAASFSLLARMEFATPVISPLTF